MQTILGAVIGASVIAILAALAGDYPNLKFWEKLPEWSQAIGTVGAIFATIWVAHRDRENVRQDAIQQEITHRKRLVAGLLAEIAAAGRTAATHLKVARKFALVEGKTGAEAHGIRVTEGEIYRSATEWIGILPEAIVTQVVALYATYGDVEKASRLHTRVVPMYTTALPLLENVVMLTEVVRTQLEKYAELGCGNQATLSISEAELLFLANKHDFPPERIPGLFKYKSVDSPPDKTT